MTAYSFGDIILVGFPHTDMQGISKRLAVVLYDAGDDDILAARITTHNYKTEADHKIIKWADSGLLAESYIRLAKLATIQKSFITLKLGELPSSEKKVVKVILRNILSL